VSTEAGEPAGEFHMSLGPFRQVVKDYSRSATATTRPSARCRPPRSRPSTWPAAASTTKGARILQERLDGKATLDQDTARRLFTLICVLQAGR
jgi:uncharacterized protein (UPF0262 family)